MRAPSYECEDCIGMKHYGCYCQAMGAARPGGPSLEDERVKSIQRNGAIFLIGLFVVVPLVIIGLWLTGNM
jgi:hypothetical protein